MNKAKFASRQVEVSKNRAVDFGGRIFLKKDFTSRLSCQSGVDYFGRAGVDMENESWKNGALSASSAPVVDGRRGDLGIYATLAWSSPAGFDLLGGARLGAFSRSAFSAGVFQERSSLAPAFFLGVTRRIKEHLTLFVNAGTAFRMPSLSEAFYTGITGRSSIVGNPGLDPEKSFNLDAGMKVQRRDLFVAVYLFQYAIRGMIEKFPLPDSAYTYANIERGRIRGLELEFRFRPLKKLELFGNGFYYRSASSAGGASERRSRRPAASWVAKLWLGQAMGRGELAGGGGACAARARRRSPCPPTASPTSRPAAIFPIA